MVKRNILYLSGINNREKYGFYNAVYNRMKILEKESKDKINISYVTVPFVDSFIVRFLKSILGLSINHLVKKEKSFLEIQPIKKSLLDYILNIFNKNHFENKLYTIIEKICIDRKISFIHVHWAYPYGFIVSQISKKYNIPYVLNIHGSDIHTNPYRNKIIMDKTVQALNGASKIYCVSSELYTQAKLFPKINNKNFKVTANAVDIPVLKNEVTKKFHICFIGTLKEIKGADRLVEIFRKVSLKIPNIELTIIGQGKYFNIIKKEKIKYNLNINLLGYKDSLEIEKLRVNYDLSLIPSKSEGFPLVVLESYANNIPVIASNCGGMIDLVLDKELLVNDNNYIENISSKIIDYYTKNYEFYKGKRELGEYIEFAKQYSWDKIIKIESEKYLK